MNLYYLHFNNYYNRIVKKFDTLAEYLTLPYYDNVATNDIAFNPNDGVDTKQVANIPVGNEFTYDYAILADGNTIVSRWFIIDANRNRNGQYTLTLRRDMFADSYEPVLDAPAFIEKATLNNNDPMIFNSENMTFNQIKTDEYLLKDSLGCPWIVGYLAHDTTIPATQVEYKLPEVYGDMTSFTSLWDLYKANNIDKDAIVVSNPEFTAYINVSTPTDNRKIFVETFGIAASVSNFDNTSPLETSNLYDAINRYKGLVKSRKSAIQSILNTNYNLKLDSTINNNIMSYNGKILADGDDYYKITINSSTLESIYLTSISPDLLNQFNIMTNENEYITGTANNTTYSLSMRTTYYTYRATPVSAESITYEVKANTNNLQDAPYKMFAIPYGACKIKYKQDADYVYKDIDEAAAKAIATAIGFNIAEQNSGQNSKLYDIQLLPYCPMQTNIDDDGYLSLETQSSYDFILSGSNVSSFIVYPLESRFTFYINGNISIKNPKIESQCDMYRLCSPNWNGVFEFNAAKNGGLRFFNVDCEYKPYQPYIHLNPDFGKLYGQDFNDARGLICSGDFSLTQTSDAWSTYERQNVNYQKTFDRQIQNMEVSNRLQNIQADIQGAVGVVGGVLGGAMAGGVVGGVVGGIASAGAAVGDAVIRRQAQAEAIDYTKDQFGYSLGNIKALPDSLTKVSAFNNNNKIFPVLEFYTCTDEEKLALENKIKYNGMTVMRIGTIREFLQEEPTYIKGKLIRMENLLEDFHYVNELANEFNKGVFI